MRKLASILALVALVALGFLTGAIAADPSTVAEAVAPVAPVVVIQAEPKAWWEVALIVVGAISTAATALAAALPGNSTVGFIARIADLANRLGVSVKPHAITPPKP